ncbi:hypothetical protein CHM34_11520 [Paludifilum halophilum]|uniref:HTH cro/C1-type domain-containing protein n=2 Tax=Paludifilum halophilum TaxID=1642702 RepID=A0A235B5C8_9BACL|nr:hypothetical protein CHM34_11520 [Paludifilum halophilum]
MTQSELAEGIISVPYLSLIENEKAHPRPDILQPLAGRLRSTMKNLMGVTDEGTIRKAENLIDRIRTALVYDGVDQALEDLTELKSLSSAIADSKVLMKIELLEINVWIHRFDEERYRNQLETFGKRWDNFEEEPNLMIWYLRLKGNIAFLKDRYEEAMLHYKAAEKILPDVTDELEKAYIFGNLGKVHLLMSNPALGILYGEKAIEIMLRKDRWVEMCSMLNILGSCHTHNGDYMEAVHCFERVLRMGNQFSISKVLISRTYHELGICYMKLQEYERATHFLHLSLEVVSPEQLPQWEVGCVHQVLCQTYIKTGEIAKAKEHILKAMDSLKHRERLRAECLIYLGQIHYAKGEDEHFIRCYMEAIESFLKMETSEKVARASHTLGKYFQSKGETDQSLIYLLLAVEHYNSLFPPVDFEVTLPEQKTTVKPFPQ